MVKLRTTSLCKSAGMVQVENYLIFLLWAEVAVELLTVVMRFATTAISWIITYMSNYFVRLRR